MHPERFLLGYFANLAIVLGCQIEDLIEDEYRGWHRYQTRRLPGDSSDYWPNKPRTVDERHQSERRSHDDTRS